MIHYYYTDGINKFGPFSLDELRTKNLTRQTQVWYQGLQNWTAAGNIPELRDLFATTPPPIHPQYDVQITYATGAPPKTWMVESILVTLFCCLPFGIVGIINAAKVESAYRIGNFAEAEQASENAKKWTMYSFWFGIAVVILYFLVILGGVFSGIY